MILVPVSAVPSQTLAVTLNGQACRIALRTNGNDLYFDLRLGNTAIALAKICRNQQRLLLGVSYRGFLGDFMFVDTQGDEQPFYTGLGDHWVLYYLTPDE